MCFDPDYEDPFEDAPEDFDPDFYEWQEQCREDENDVIVVLRCYGEEFE